MKGFLTISALLALLYCNSTVAHYSTGVDAYNKGDYATAFKQWKPLAKKGVADAQYNIGWMYDYGMGVKKYYKGAVKWYQLGSQSPHTADIVLGSAPCEVRARHNVRWPSLEHWSPPVGAANEPEKSIPSTGADSGRSAAMDA